MEQSSPRFMLISELMRELLTAREAATRSLDDVDLRVLQGATTQRHLAEQEVARIGAEIRGLVMQDTAVVFPIGKFQKEFVELAEDDGAIVIPGNALYDCVTKLVTPFLDHGKFTFETGQAYIAALKQAAKYAGITSFLAPTMLLGQEMTPGALAAYVKESIRTSNGDHFSALYLEELIYERVLRMTYDQNTVVAVVTDVSEEEAKGDLGVRLMGGRTVTVDVNNPPERNDIVALSRTLKPLFQRATTLQLEMNAYKARIAKAQKRALTTSQLGADGSPEHDKE